MLYYYIRGYGGDMLSEYIMLISQYTYELSNFNKFCDVPVTIYGVDQYVHMRIFHERSCKNLSFKATTRSEFFRKKIYIAFKWFKHTIVKIFTFPDKYFYLYICSCPGEGKCFSYLHKMFIIWCFFFVFLIFCSRIFLIYIVIDTKK